MDMKMPNIDRLRESLLNYLARKGHGAITDLEKESAIARQTITRFRDGGNPDTGTAIKLQECLRKKGYYTEGAPTGGGVSTDPRLEATWAKNRVLLKGVTSRDPASILAMRLQGLADTLLSSDFTPQHKAKEFVVFVERAHESIDEYAAAIEKSSNGL